MDAEDDTLIVLEPSKNAVLLGSGGSTNRHPGNRYFREQVALRREEYVNTPKHREYMKKEIATEIVDDILNHQGGRFLAKRKGSGPRYKRKGKGLGYTVVSRAKAITKTMQALRNAKDYKCYGSLTEREGDKAITTSATTSSNSEVKSQKKPQRKLKPKKQKQKQKQKHDAKAANGTFHRATAEAKPSNRQGGQPQQDWQRFCIIRGAYHSDVNQTIPSYSDFPYPVATPASTATNIPSASSGSHEAALFFAMKQAQAQAQAQVPLQGAIQKAVQQQQLYSTNPSSAQLPPEFLQVLQLAEQRARNQAVSVQGIPFAANNMLVGQSQSCAIRNNEIQAPWPLREGTGMIVSPTTDGSSAGSSQDGEMVTEQQDQKIRSEDNGKMSVPLDDFNPTEKAASEALLRLANIVVMEDRRNNKRLTQRQRQTQAPSDEKDFRNNNNKEPEARPAHKRCQKEDSNQLLSRKKRKTLPFAFRGTKSVISSIY